MLEAQIKLPVKGDFYQTIKDIIKEFDIKDESFEKSMNKNAFKNVVRDKCKEAALKYLLEKQSRGRKGEGIKYKYLQMADYLMPQSNISITDQREIFNRPGVAGAVVHTASWFIN